MRPVLSALGLLVALAGVGLQFAISVPLLIDTGSSFVGALISLLSFFTILTNIGAGLVYLATLTGRPSPFVDRRVRDGLLSSIIMVALVYHVVLAALWEPQGAQLIADTLLHTVAPALYLVWWLATGRTGKAALRDVPRWLVYPLVYLGYTLVRGAIVAEYPYPFLDLASRTLLQVAISVGIILLIFGVLSLFVICADRMLPTPRPIQD